MRSNRRLLCRGHGRVRSGQGELRNHLRVQRVAFQQVDRPLLFDDPGFPASAAKRQTGNKLTDLVDRVPNRRGPNNVDGEGRFYVLEVTLVVRYPNCRVQPKIVFFSNFDEKFHA